MNTTQKLMTLMLAWLMCSVGAEAQEAYAVFTEADSTLTFFYDELRNTHSGTTYDLNTGANTPDWFENRYNVSQVLFDPSFAAARPTSTYLWFGEMINMQSITGLEYLNTSDVTDMAGMFTNCSVLTRLDLSGFNTSNVRNMERMFLACRLLTTLDLSSFNTLNVTRMNQMFSYCRSLVSLDLSSFNTSNVTNMKGMFHSCNSLIALDLSGFNTSNVTDMGGMFYSCNHLETIYASNSWSSTALTYSDYMFSGCANLVGGHGTAYDENYVDATYAHIDEGPSNPGYFTGKGIIMPGDVNNDGEVNIADVNEVIDVILGGGSNAAADVNNDGEINVADINVVIDIILGGGHSTPVEHEWVDLGLPSGTLWATCNIGATKPEEYGDYFAWGETEPKEGFYNWGTYKWANGGSSRKITKYCTDSYYGTVDGKTELELEDDAAYVNWGPKWHMPSAEQQAELVDNCISSWTSINGVYGRLVTGPNGNSLFLPASGYRWDGSLNYVDVRGQYWSRTLISDYSDQAVYLDFYSGHIQTFCTQRSIGQVVRAVRVSPAEGPNLYIEQRSLDLGDVSVGDSLTGELTIVNNTAETMTVAVTVDAPFSFKQEENSVSSINIVVPSNTRDTVTVMFTATTPGEFTGNVIFQCPGLEEGLSIIPVHAHAYMEDAHEWVDLGLPSGTLWATMNVGANAPEESGDYFAWGETEPKENYGWSTYKWCNGSDNTLTKYCTENYYGTVDNRIELEPEDDAAYVNWSPAWRIPSDEQFDELRGNCSWEWTSMNDVIGYIVTGPNGNTLFLPAADYMAGSWLWGEECGNYWSRTCFPNQSYRALDLNFYSWKVGRTGNPRSFGSTVRAVRAPHD